MHQEDVLVRESSRRREFSVGESSVKFGIKRKSKCMSKRT